MFLGNKISGIVLHSDTYPDLTKIVDTKLFKDHLRIVEWIRRNFGTQTVLNNMYALAVGVS